MSVNDLFIKGNKFFLENNFFGGLDVFKEIWLQFPKNKRLEEEINKKINKFKQPLTQTHSKKEIENFFNIKIEYLENRSIKNLTKSNKFKGSRIFLAYYFKGIRLIDNF